MPHRTHRASRSASRVSPEGVKLRPPPPDEVWRCSACGFRNLDKVDPACLSCGRDYFGIPRVTRTGKPKRLL